MIAPRWYQKQLLDGAQEAWAVGHKNLLLVSPPRSGKTKTAVWLSEPFLQRGEHVCFQVHREELVRQICMEYAEFGYEHNILAPDDVIASIIQRQVAEFGRSFFNPNAIVTIGGVDTINARAARLVQWASRIRLWMTDEAHHLLVDNKWGKVVALFPHAFGVGFTATPARTDRKSLARSQGGVFDHMVLGPTARRLIDEGHICDYRIIAPPSSIDRDNIRTGKSGDFTQKGLTDAQKHSTITGDCVASYQRFTPGEQAVVFAVDIDHAIELCKAYQAAGIDAEVVSSKTNKSVRKAIMKQFEDGQFQVLCNVDLFGEGLNVLGISTVIMARPTKSFVLYVQQFFRALTKADGKHIGTIIDHAGNVGYFGAFYGLPDTYNNWTLENEERGKRTTRDPDVTPVTTCTECFEVYEAIHKQCPYCGHTPVPADRSAPEHVTGDLEELDLETLRQLRGEIERIDWVPDGKPSSPADYAIRRNHEARQKAQSELREAIALWAGVRRDEGDTDSMIYRRFYLKFGTDVMTAQTLGAADAAKLKERIEDTWPRKIMTLPGLA